jgi:hypothetical protein
MRLKLSMRITTSILICVLAVGLASCATPPTAPPLQQYGTPSDGKIQVTIGGDVKYPGRYWVSESSSLATIQELFGGWGGAGDFGGEAPTHVVLVRMVNGQQVRTKYPINIPPDQKAAVLLKNGDFLYYPTVVF